MIQNVLDVSFVEHLLSSYDMNGSSTRQTVLWLSEMVKRHLVSRIQKSNFNRFKKKKKECSASCHNFKLGLGTWETSNIHTCTLTTKV